MLIFTRRFHRLWFSMKPYVRIFCVQHTGECSAKALWKSDLVVYEDEKGMGEFIKIACMFVAAVYLVVWLTGPAEFLKL